MNRLRGVIVMLIFAACSSESSGTHNGSVSGAVAGQSFLAEDSIALVGQLQGSGVSLPTSGAPAPPASVADVVLTTWSGACSSLIASSQPPNAGALFVAVAGTGAVGPGTYDLSPSSGSASVSYAADAAKCASTARLFATSGTVTYDSVTSSSIIGSIDAVFSSGEVMGTFTAPICDGPLANVEVLAYMTGTCQP
jgi:hypothetical protein